MTAQAQPRSSSAAEGRIRFAVPARAPELVLALLCVTAFVVVMHAGRGLTFFYDEWDFILHKRGISLRTFLEPHGGEQPSVLPIAIYKVMLQVFGLASYAPYRALVALFHIGCAVLLYVYARARIGAWWALVPATLLLFLGSAWQDILWSFQIGFLLSIASGIGMLIVLDDGPRGDWLACLLLLISLTSSALGFAFVAIACIEIALDPRRWSRAYVVAVPVVVVAILYLGWGGNAPEQPLADGPHTVSYALDMAAAGAGGLIGQGLDWGRPLLAAGVVVLATLAFRRAAILPRVGAVAAGAVTLSLLTGVSRAAFQPPVPPDTSRYIYPSAVLLLLLSVSVIAPRPGPIRPAAALVAAVATALACVMGTGALAEGGNGLRAVSTQLRPELAALEAARGHVDPSFVIDPQLAPQITALPYYAAVDAFGSPAPTLAQVRGGPVDEQALFDAALARALGVAPKTATVLRSAGTAPRVELATGGQLSTRGACDVFRSSGSGAALDFTLALGQGVSVRADPGPPVELRLRRIASMFLPSVSSGSVAGGATVTLAAPRDRLTGPWHARLSPRQPVEVCSAGR
jgi:hypothetical protein